MKYIINLNEVSLKDINLVGGKNASLGEMIQNIESMGIKVPNGFAVTTNAYRDFIDFNGLQEQVVNLVSGLDDGNLPELRRVGAEVRQLIRNGIFPPKIKEEIRERYQQLSESYGQNMIDVAVRSSATAEDLPDASFAGQQETFLNVRGSESILEAVRNCFASLFTDRAISYRNTFNYNHFDIALSVCIQKMVRSDMAASGVAFSLDPESGFKDVVVINSSWGLGEMIVQGAVSPDEFIIFKPSLEQGFSSIIEKKIGNKDKKMIYGEDHGKLTKTVTVSDEDKEKFSITDQQALEIARWVSSIEKYYSKLKGRWCPMDVEWAIDGISNDLYIVQARPETIHSQNKTKMLVEYHVQSEGIKPIVTGIAVGDRAASGKVVIMHSVDGNVNEHLFEEGSILVTEMTDPDWEPIMKKASAIITNKGGRTCHAAIVAREMGLPAIVGCFNATEILKEKQMVTVSCAEGDSGFVYDGYVEFHKTETSLEDLPKVKTPIMLNVASPDIAFKFAHLPNAGVGLAREEFIINNYIRVHPMALLKHNELNDKNLSEQIRKITLGYDSEETFFIKRLSYGIARIASSFYPNKVIVRLSDFKSNEYYNLLGGSYFEPIEENPMIGWRGASRYYSEAYEPAFGMEIKAIKRVREKMGLKNVVVMIPFCRTVGELLKVYETMEKYGLKRGENGLEVYLMAELPSNIFMADEFAKHIDGFSIGSNDLTQLVLGLDRDSALVAHIYDERNTAVKRAISHLIKVGKENGVKVGICGQGPSDFPDFAQFLVEEGIDSISVTPDSLLKTLKALESKE
ncbi:MAG: phosphoenolpyruvate synthase [Flavobacteriaceae bacterium]|nr:phosphoenolpyruvate synthase [Flavobacteriaceae bacterium]